ncbi:MAG: peptidoglycan-binding domain-containing protein [Pseudomonadota bacterium]
MSIVNQIFGNGANFVLQNPARSTGVILFGVAFTLVATNALLSQGAVHPAPIWNSQEREFTKVISTGPKIVPVKKVEPHRVLTQSISLKNIPVPTSNPSKRSMFAAQSSLVREVQASLSDVGIYTGKIDGIHGDETKRAIQEFQEKAGILPDGEASYGLLANIKSAFAVAQVRENQGRTPTSQNLLEQPQMIVMDHALVSKVQTGLSETYGDQEIAIDGIFGNQTRDALRRFQKRFKLPVTGELDQATLDKLHEAGVLSSI